MWLAMAGVWLACVAPDSLSDDEDVLVTPPLPDAGADSATALALEAWAPRPTPLEGAPPIAAGTLEAAREDSQSLACTHSGIVAPCGSLAFDPSADLGAAADVAVHYLLSTEGAAMCSWEVTYRIVGIRPGDSGQVSMSMSVDDEPSEEMSTSTTYEAAAR